MISLAETRFFNSNVYGLTVRINFFIESIQKTPMGCCLFKGECPACDGTAIFDCYICEGKGKKSETGDVCSKCEGTGNMVCLRCKMTPGIGETCAEHFCASPHTILHGASKCNNAEEINKVFETSCFGDPQAYINGRNQRGDTALCVAARRGAVEAGSALVQGRADINNRNYEEVT